MRPAAEVKAEQDRIAEHFKLEWWYHTGRKCCGVYPKLMQKGDPASALVYYECEVCGSKTAEFLMPWQAAKAWDKGEVSIHNEQLTLFNCDKHF